MTEILHFKMKISLLTYSFIEREEGLLSINETDLKTKQQGLTSPTQLTLGLLWACFLPPWPWDIMFFSCKCLKLYEGCAAACQTDVFTVGKGGCRCTAWKRFMMMNHYLAQLCPRSALWVIFPLKMPKQCLKGVLFGTYTNPFREQANNLNMWMVRSPVPGLTP